MLTVATPVNKTEPFKAHGKSGIWGGTGQIKATNQLICNDNLKLVGCGSPIFSKGIHLLLERGLYGGSEGQS